MRLPSRALPKRIQYHRVSRKAYLISKKQDRYTRGSMVNAWGRTRHGLRDTRGTYLDHPQEALKKHNPNHKMSMIHTLRKSINNRIKNTSEHMRLALKMSAISFVVLVVILTLIISMSYIWGRERLYREFREEIRLFGENPLGRAIWSWLLPEGWDIPVPISDRMREWWRGPRGMRDVLIFSHEKQILQNDLIDIEPDDIVELYSVDSDREWVFENRWHHYITYRRDYVWGTVFFVRDIEQLRDFHEWLILIAISGSILWLVIIYFLSHHLARLVIEPIREHNRELEAYSHNVAHELKTPLSVMGSNMELLRMAPSDKLIHSTEEEISSMKHIIDTLLLLAHPEKTEHHQESIDIVAHTARILENYSAHDILFSHEKKEIHLDCNRELYTRIIKNLIENSIKYQTHGSISVHIWGWSIQISNPVEKDLPREVLRKLTHAFYQGDTSRHSDGQWLGLALVDKIVRLYGWDMEISSEKKIFRVVIQWG